MTLEHERVRPSRRPGSERWFSPRRRTIARVRGARASPSKAGCAPLLRRLCGDRQQADDLAQEAFLRAWQELGRLREPRAFSGWLRRLAVRLLIDVRRLKRLRFRGVAALDADSGKRFLAELHRGS